MSTKAGWAEPGFIMSQPRIQKVAGFNYFFCEKKQVLEQDAGPVWKALVPIVQAAYVQEFGDIELPSLLVMFLEYPDNPKLYDVQVGYGLQKIVIPCGEAQVRRVKATLVVGILAWGSIASVPYTYDPLLDFMRKCGYPGGKEWREWQVYDDKAPSSHNSIVWVQHDLKEKV
jgi:hypothetical protein